MNRPIRKKEAASFLNEAASLWGAKGNAIKHGKLFTILLNYPRCGAPAGRIDGLAVVNQVVSHHLELNGLTRIS